LHIRPIAGAEDAFRRGKAAVSAVIEGQRPVPDSLTWP